jgi:hypothetical protein
MGRLDVNDFIVENGGDPKKIKESQKRRCVQDGEALVDEIIGLFGDHKKSLSFSFPLLLFYLQYAALSNMDVRSMLLIQHSSNKLLGRTFFSYILLICQKCQQPNTKLPR